MKKLEMSKLVFDTAKSAFKKLYRKHKAEVSRTKKTKGAVPTVPYQLKKADIKKKIRGTKFTAKADIKAKPGLRRRILLNIERSKRDKKKYGSPVIYGKAYASDKKGKTMQIPALSAAARKQMKKEMAESAKRNYLRVRKRSLGYNKGKFVKSDPDIYVDVFGKQRSIKKPKQDTIGKKKFIKTDTYVDYKGRQHNIGKQPIKKNKGGMPARNKRNFRPTKSGAGMTRAGVKAFRRLNPGSKLKTAVTGDVKAGSKAAKRRKSYCARSLGQLKRASAKTRNDPNSRIRQSRRRWKC